jgi:protein involved in polysaccharide export with SLBB domain
VVEATALEGALDPASYQVGPGDRFLIEMWGLHDLSATVEVNPEGRLSVPHVGVFSARGETLAGLRGAVEKRLREVYPTLHGGMTLQKPRTFLVTVGGAVAHPGNYPATPVTRVSALVALAGGALPRASTRAVQVRRPSSTEAIVADLLRFNLLGERGGDPTVLDGDSLFVPLRQTEVEVTGAVRRPGRYELTGSGDLDELLRLAGGYAPDASTTLPLRVSARQGTDRVGVRSVKRDDKVPLHDGDVVHVPSLTDFRRVVIVEGAVVGPAEASLPDATRIMQFSPYQTDRRNDAPVSTLREISVPVAFVDGDGVRDVINKVGGLQPWADAASAFVLRPASVGSPTRISVDVPAVASGNAPDVEVRPGDTLVVPSRRDSILVGGAVQHPGLYQYNPGLHPLDYITMAGGTLRTANEGAARLLRHGGGSILLSKATTVEPGDAISVPEKKITVAEWVEITLILGNLAVGTAALALTAMK